MQKKKNVKNITIEILISIRDEIVKLREDTNARFEQMDRRFEQMDARFEQMDGRFERMEKDISSMKQDIKSMAAHFDRDFILLANDVENVKTRLTVFEKELMSLKEAGRH